MATNDPAEAVRKRTRQLLWPFVEEFREPPDGASADQPAALGAMSGGVLPAAVDEYMRVVGGDGDAVGLLFAGQDSFDAATAIEEGPPLLAAAARYGAAPALLETAIPYTSSDPGVWWLGPDEGEAVIDPSIRWCGRSQRARSRRPSTSRAIDPPATECRHIEP